MILKIVAKLITELLLKSFFLIIHNRPAPIISKKANFKTRKSQLGNYKFLFNKKMKINENHKNYRIIVLQIS
jgi:hypothetical protein